uniref:Uncharacterized protein n=1 Tax=Amphimedon queenslandica TaxID=400682 RepID=A0A1X7VHL6_AMPQE
MCFYDCFLKLATDIGKSICDQFETDGVVCSHKLRQGVFTTAAVDNINYNPSFTTSKESFHGTGISLIQHLCHDNKGNGRGIIILKASTSNTFCSIKPLPTEYNNDPPASIKEKDINVLENSSFFRSESTQAITIAMSAEVQWLDKVMEAISKEDLDKNEWLLWSAHHASLQENDIPSATITALMPLFLDNALRSYD